MTSHAPLKLSPGGRRYGYHRSPDDPRDKIADPSGLTILPEVDQRANKAMPAIWDQLQLGACTANAVNRCLQFDLSVDRRLQGLGNAHRRSRLDLYYGERSLEGDLGQGDTGAYGRDGFKYAQQTGVLLESVWEYTDAPSGPGSYEGPPPPGKRHLLSKPYAAVQQDISHIKAVLSNDQLIAFGFQVYSEFESSQVASQGIVDVPGPREQLLGGHEVVMVGYLAAFPGYVLCANSWGTGWGTRGFFLMSWDYATSTDLTGDLRTIVRAVA